MAQLNPFAMAVKLGDFPPTDSTCRVSERAFYLDDVITALVRSHFQNRHVGYVQRKCDLRSRFVALLFHMIRIGSEFFG